jgi:hypothetical protein
MGKENDMLTSPKESKRTKPISKIQVGLIRRQKDIMKDFVGKSPKLPIDLNTVRDWEKYGDH